VNSKFTELQKLGVGDFEHLNGSLIDHLTATYDLLKQWEAGRTLCDAGLYHAAYGTDAFDTRVVSLTRRQDIAHIIGEEAEALVYLYCSCDREYVFSRIGHSVNIQFKDRFTKEEFELTPLQAKQFCELTVANELELAMSSREFLVKHGKTLHKLFLTFEPYLTLHANNAVSQILAPSE
jgi:hypothetical protein